MKTKIQYRIRNWSKYNAALIERGSLTLWVDEEARTAWRSAGPPQRGAQYVYADAAIKCVLTLRAVYHRALRATEGLARSLFVLLSVPLPVPSYSTLSRRAAELGVALGAVPRSGPLHLVIDSSGFKVYGEGEWKVRLHGLSKRRTWRKLHLAVNEATGEIVWQSPVKPECPMTQPCLTCGRMCRARWAKSAPMAPTTNGGATRRSSRAGPKP